MATTPPLLKIGILQITGQPAARVGSHDLFAEPLPGRFDLHLGPLVSAFPQLKGFLREVRTEHLAWTTSRVVSLLRDLQNQPGGPPDILVLPEYFGPLELLPDFKAYVDSTKTVLLAGTHSRTASASANALYKQIGVDPASLSTLPMTAPLLPILEPNRAILRQKHALSPPEVSEVAPPEDELPILPILAPATFQGLTVGPLICLEALRQPHFVARPKLIAIVARERDPARFAAFVETCIVNKQPVILANDAEFGGSGVFLVVDNRAFGGWWFESPVDGRLPAGEAYLEVQIDLSARAVEVGTARPAHQAFLLRLASIYGDGDPVLALERKGSELAAAGSQAELRTLAQEILSQPGASPVTKLRWQRVSDLVEANAFDEVWSRVLLLPLLTATPALSQHYGAAAARAARVVEGLLRDPSSLAAPPAALGGLVARQQLFSREVMLAQPDVAHLVERSALPIGRNDIIRDLRHAMSADARSFVVTTGTAGIGKSLVTETAFIQAHLGPLVIDCPQGASADYLFEYMMRSAGLIPSGVAPRPAFGMSEIRRGLTGVKALWFTSVQHLLDATQWATPSIGAFFRAIGDSLSHTSVSVVVLESTRELPLELEAGVQLLRRRLRGLSTPDARDLFSQQLRKAGLPDDAVTAEQRSAIATLLDGHPTLLSMAAAACGQSGPEPIIRDLKARGRVYQSLVRVLVSGLALKQPERTFLAAMMQCRLPVPKDLVNYVLPPEEASVALLGLLGTGLLEALPGELVQITGILRDGILDELRLSSEVSMRFHNAAIDYFWALANRSTGADYLRAAIEANYHAALAGERQPFETGGLRDGLVGAARQRYEREEFSDVIDLLEPLIKDQLRATAEDILTLLADSYAWSNRTEDAMRIAEELVRRDRSHVWIYFEIVKASLHSKRPREAERALAKAEEIAPSDYRVGLNRGIIFERRGEARRALDCFEDAANRTTKDAWPFFWLTRCLRKLGLPQEALEAVDRSREFVSEQGGRIGRRLEMALLSEEMFCLFLVGETERGLAIARFIAADPNASPEALVSAAYGEAVAVTPFDEKTAIAAFERAIASLETQSSRRAHAKATIALFRGKLFERLDNLQRAEVAFRDAVTQDPFNAHMNECCLRVLMTQVRKHQRAGQEGAARSVAQDVLRSAKAVLKLVPNNNAARDAQEAIYSEFGIQ